MTMNLNELTFSRNQLSGPKEMLSLRSRPNMKAECINELSKHMK
jgi:hypothetical protein